MLPSLGHEGDRAAYDRWFDREMALCGCLALIGVALALRALGAGPARTAAALLLVAVSPLALGSVVLSRFDLWPAALAVLALAALLHERLALAALALGAAIAAKLWPVGARAARPRARLAHARPARGGNVDGRARRGPRRDLPAVRGPLPRRPARELPRADRAPAPAREPRLRGAHRAAPHRRHQLHVVSSFGSQNLAGTGTHAAEIATTVAGVLALVTVWALYARAPTRRRAPRRARRGRGRRGSSRSARSSRRSS